MIIGVGVEVEAVLYRVAIHVLVMTKSHGTLSCELWRDGVP